MNEQAGQSEVLEEGANPSIQGEENGATEVTDGATSGDGQGHEGEDGSGQGETQSKSQGSKQRLRRKFRESEARNAQLAEDNRKLNERLASLEQQVDGVINPPKQRPNRVNFDSEEEYEDALFEWRDDAASRQQSQPLQQDQHSGAQQQSAQMQPQVPKEVIDKWMDQCDDAAEKYEDFDQVINNPNIPISPVMADTVRMNAQGAEIAYYLGKNPAVAASIAQMPFVQQVTEIQALAGKFTTSATNAPDPIDPPRGGDDTLGIKNPEKMSPEEYRDWRRSQGMRR